MSGDESGRCGSKTTAHSAKEYQELLQNFITAGKGDEGKPRGEDRSRMKESERIQNRNQAVHDRKIAEITDKYTRRSRGSLERETTR